MKKDLLDMLRDIAHRRPLTRNLINLSDSPASIQTHRLDTLEALGLVERDGHYLQLTQFGKSELARVESITPPRTIVNAGSTETYRPSWTTVRPGADDHKQYRSLGIDGGRA